MAFFTLFALGILSLGLLGLFFYYEYVNNNNNRSPAPYLKRNYFYSTEERKFLAALVYAVGKEFLIMGKVRLADILILKPDLSAKGKVKAYEKICHESIAFVLCDKKNGKIVAVLQLYSDNQKIENQMRKSAFLQQALKSVDLPFLSFKENISYNSSEVRNSIFKALKIMPDLQDKSILKKA